MCLRSLAILLMQAGVPCVAISNFTWDWIYEPYARDHLARLEEAYSRMHVLLRLPFAQTDRLSAFPRIVDAPLIAHDYPSDVARGNSRTRVLLGSRARVSDEALARAAAEGPEFEFLVPPVSTGFAEALASCDLVVAKLGFSLLAECIAAGKRLLYPPRVDFREETIMQAEVAKHLPALSISLDDFYSGNWTPHLRNLTSMPPVISPSAHESARDSAPSSSPSTHCSAKACGRP